jgi:ABC-type phosphate/phosphonate transport system substrate-binding protein
MIANARMYAVSPEAAGRWRALLTAIVAASGISVDVIEHPAPAPLEDLWRRTDQGAVFMCGLPFSRSVPQPVLMAAPVPSPAEYGGEPRYWSELVVRRDSGYRSVSDTFGGRLALTVPGSQSGCVAALSFFMSAEREPPLFAEVIAPTVTPLGALSAVVRGDADIAPIDSYAFALLGRYRPDLAEQVRIVGRTTPTPIPPLVASQAGLEALQSAFLEAICCCSVSRGQRPPHTRYSRSGSRWRLAIGRSTRWPRSWIPRSFCECRTSNLTGCGAAAVWTGRHHGAEILAATAVLPVE